MATIPSVQLFRNSNIITGREAAITALETQMAKVADGGLILARYSEDGSENGVKTLLGIVRNGGGTNVQLTVIDVEGAAQNVQKAITSAINGLNKQDNAVDGQYVASVSEKNGIISVSRKALPSLTTQSSSGKAVTAITQSNGLVSVAFGGVAAANVSVADASGKFTADNVEAVLLEIQNSLDSAIGQGGSVGTQISAAINELDSSKSGNTTHVSVKVDQVNGKISAVTVSENDIASAALLGTTADTSTATTAFGKIAKEAADRAAAINALDLVSVGGTGKVITTVSQTDGKVSAAATDLTAANVKATASNSSTTAVAVTGTTVAAQISSLAKSIKSVGSDAKSYSIASITGDSLTALGTNVREAYKLVDEDGTQAGSTIKIYKDSSLKSVALNGQTLNFTYILTDGSENTVGVDVSTFLAESEFSNGLQVVNHVVSVKRDGASESFLTVSASGVKVSGIQSAINTATGSVNTAIDARLGAGVTASSTATAQFAALKGTSASTSGETSVYGAKAYADAKVASVSNQIANLDATVKGTSTHVDVTVAQLDGKVTGVTVTNKDIASASALTTETNNRTSADTALSNRLGTGVTSTSTATAQLLALSGSSSDASGVTSVNGAKTYAKNYADSKIASLDATVTSVSGTSTTEAIKIVQTDGKISRITLGTFDCGVY